MMHGNEFVHSLLFFRVVRSWIFYLSWRNWSKFQLMHFMQIVSSKTQLSKLSTMLTNFGCNTICIEHKIVLPQNILPCVQRTKMHLLVVLLV